MREFDISTFLREDICFYQLKSGFRYGTDTFLLADFVKLKSGEKVMDLGTGCGVIPILLLKKYQHVTVTGIDVLGENVLISKKNAELNGVDNKFLVRKVDVRQIKEVFKPGSFNVVFTNPPFVEMDGGILKRLDTKTVAKHELLGTIEDFISAASYLLNTLGRFYMVCNTKRFVDVIQFCRMYRLEPKQLRFIHSKKDKPAFLFLLKAVKSAGKGVEIAKPMVLYKDDGSYSEELRDKYEQFFTDT